MAHNSAALLPVTLALLLVRAWAQQCMLALGGGYSCGLTDEGAVYCWGMNDFAQLGLGHTQYTSAPTGLPVDLGRSVKAVQISVGWVVSCATLSDGSAKCWGLNLYGQLGQGYTSTAVGDAHGELGDDLPAINLGTNTTVLQLAVMPGDALRWPGDGSYHLDEGSVCALVTNNQLKCWGINYYGQLGYGDTRSRGARPEDMGDNLLAVDLGTGLHAVQIAPGLQHVCAILNNHQTKCWGRNQYGQLGVGDTTDRGKAPGQMGDNLPAVDLGTGLVAVKIAGGLGHNCAVLNTGQIKCWGANRVGQLGLGDTERRGNGEGPMGDALPVVDLGTDEAGANLTALDVDIGFVHTCVLLTDHTVKCWGNNYYGQLGAGHPRDVGALPGQMGNALPRVNLGTGVTVRSINLGAMHTCVVTTTGGVKCWGWNVYGQLGLGDNNNRGTSAAEMGDGLPWVIIPRAKSTDAPPPASPSTSMLPLQNGVPSAPMLPPPAPLNHPSVSDMSLHPAPNPAAASHSSSNIKGTTIVAVAASAVAAVACFVAVMGYLYMRRVRSTAKVDAPDSKAAPIPPGTDPGSPGSVGFRPQYAFSESDLAERMASFRTVDTITTQDTSTTQGSGAAKFFRCNALFEEYCSQKSASATAPHPMGAADACVHADEVSDGAEAMQKPGGGPQQTANSAPGGLGGGTDAVPQPADAADVAGAHGCTRAADVAGAHEGTQAMDAHGHA